MRIAIVAPPYIPIPPDMYGGIERVIQYLIKGLIELGHEPILLASGDSKVDCELIPIIDKAKFFPKKAAKLPAFRREMENIHKNTEQLLRDLMPRVDIIHGHSDLPAQSFDTLKVADFPNLTTLHGVIQMDDMPFYAARKDSLFYVSISKNQQRLHPGLHYMGIIYNGENPKDFPMITRPDDYLCFLGRYDSLKNPHLAIELAVNLGMKIKVAGKLDHEGADYYKKKIQKFEGHPLVELMGELGFEKKVELLSKAKCNLHPISLREPFGLSVIEAAYCGTPTLAVSRGSMPELIEEGRTGLLVEDIAEGYHYINECFEMDRRYIAHRARLLFNYKTMAKQYVKAYEQVLQIFDLKTPQRQTILDIAGASRQLLEDVWHAEIINKSKPNPKPKTKLQTKLKAKT